MKPPRDRAVVFVYKLGFSAPRRAMKFALQANEMACAMKCFLRKHEMRKAHIFDAQGKFHFMCEAYFMRHRLISCCARATFHSASPLQIKI